MPKLQNQRSLLAKLESSSNSDSSPTGSANYLEVIDLEIEPLSSDEVEQEVIRPYAGNFATQLANTKVNISFGVYLSGSGSAGVAPKMDAVLKSCGLTSNIVSSTSVTYSPATLATQDSCTIYCNYDGVLHKVLGCKGSFTISANVNEFPRINFELQGIKSTITDTSQVSITKSAQSDPLLFKDGNTSAFQLFGYSGALQSWELDFANEVVFRTLVGGTQEAIITDRKPTGTCVIEAVALSAHNFFTDAEGTSTGNNTWLHGTTAGNKVTVSVPQSNLGMPSYEDADGITMLSLPFNALPTSAGNNEFSLVFT